MLPNRGSGNRLKKELAKVIIEQNREITTLSASVTSAKKDIEDLKRLCLQLGRKCDLLTSKNRTSVHLFILGCRTTLLEFLCPHVHITEICSQAPSCQERRGFLLG
jgi:hypothetical protein